MIKKILILLSLCSPLLSQEGYHKPWSRKDEIIGQWNFIPDSNCVRQIGTTTKRWIGYLCYLEGDSAVLGFIRVDSIYVADSMDIWVNEAGDTMTGVLFMDDVNIEGLDTLIFNKQGKIYSKKFISDTTYRRVLMGIGDDYFFGFLNYPYWWSPDTTIDSTKWVKGMIEAFTSLYMHNYDILGIHTAQGVKASFLEYENFPEWSVSNWQYIDANPDTLDIDDSLNLYEKGWNVWAQIANITDADTLILKGKHWQGDSLVIVSSYDTLVFTTNSTDSFTGIWGKIEEILATGAVEADSDRVKLYAFPSVNISVPLADTAYYAYNVPCDSIKDCKVDSAINSDTSGYALTYLNDSAYADTAGYALTYLNDSAFADTAGYALTYQNDSAFADTAGFALTYRNDSAYADTSGYALTYLNDSAYADSSTFSDTAEYARTYLNDSAFADTSGYALTYLNDSAYADTSGYAKAYLNDSAYADTAGYAKSSHTGKMISGGMSDYRFTMTINVHDSIPYLVLDNKHSLGDSMLLHISSTGLGDPENILVVMPDSIQLTVGTARVPYDNYVYYRHNAGNCTLMVSATKIEHTDKGAIPDSLVSVGHYGLFNPSASDIPVSPFNDYRNVSNKHMVKTLHRLRYRTSYESGIDITVRKMTVAITSGLVLQGTHTYIRALDNRNGDKFLIPTYPDSNYAHKDSLTGLTLYSDSVVIGAVDELWLVVWIDASEDSLECKYILSIQAGSETFTKPIDVEHALHMMPLTLPNRYQETAFPICAVIYSNQGDSLVYFKNGSKYKDLREVPPAVAGGGAGAPASVVDSIVWKKATDYLYIYEDGLRDSTPIHRVDSSDITSHLIENDTITGDLTIDSTLYVNKTIRIRRVDVNGITIDSAGNDGIYILEAYVGMTIDRSWDDGITVDSAGANGFRVSIANDEGFYVGTAGKRGFRVTSANVGFKADSADTGISVKGTSMAGYFEGNVFGTQNARFDTVFSKLDYDSLYNVPDTITYADTAAYSVLSDQVVDSIRTFLATIYDPDGIQPTSDDIPIFFVDTLVAPNGITVHRVGIRTDLKSSYSVGFEIWGKADSTSTRTLKTVATSTSVRADSTVGSDVGADSTIHIDLPATSVNYLQIWGIYHIK